MAAEDVYQDNSYQYEFAVTAPADATGVKGPKTGLVDLVAFMSATADASSGPIHTDLQATVTERSGKPGTYYAKIPKSAINARLYGTVGTAADFRGQSIYVVGMNADVESYSKVHVRVGRKSG